MRAAAKLRKLPIDPSQATLGPDLVRDATIPT